METDQQDQPAAALEARFEGHWRPRVLISCLVAAGALLGSWNLAATRALWDRLDVWFFRLLNDTLFGPEWWRATVAVANNRKFDLVSFVITVIFFALFVCSEQRRYLVRRCAAAVMVTLFILGVRKFVDIDLFQIERHSPTRVLHGAVRLSQEIDWINTKDASKKSFPADHTLFLMMLNAFFWYYGGRQWGLRYLWIMALFSLPRLIGGAHWLTDALVGSAFILLIAMPLLLATPLHAFLLRWFIPPSRFVVGRFQPG